MRSKRRRSNSGICSGSQLQHRTGAAAPRTGRRSTEPNWKQPAAARRGRRSIASRRWLASYGHGPRQLDRRPIDGGPDGYYANPGAFEPPPSGEWGNAPRNSIRGPSQFSVNANASRTFHFAIAGRSTGRSTPQHPQPRHLLGHQHHRRLGPVRAADRANAMRRIPTRVERALLSHANAAALTAIGLLLLVRPLACSAHGAGPQGSSRSRSSGSTRLVVQNVFVKDKEGKPSTGSPRRTSWSPKTTSGRRSRSSNSSASTTYRPSRPRRRARRRAAPAERRDRRATCGRIKYQNRRLLVMYFDQSSMPWPTSSARTRTRGSSSTSRTTPIWWRSSRSERRPARPDFTTTARRCGRSSR